MPEVLIAERDGVVRPPWEAAPSGVVSLLAMLDFSAREYEQISYEFGFVIATLRMQPQAMNLGSSIKKLVDETNRLGLLVTREALGEYLLEVVKASKPGTVQISGHGDERVVNFDDVGLNNERTCHHIEAIYSTLKAELRTTLFKVIPRERSKYNDESWIEGFMIESCFPTSFQELVRGGICYSLGQPTACVFHAMRALEPGLSALAKPFNISASHDNWQNIIDQIEASVRAIGVQPKSVQKIEEEKFFGAATSHLYFVKNAWRNHVAHTRENYSDDQAIRILSRTEEFIESLSTRLKE
jgi:hypothetical protein